MSILSKTGLVVLLLAAVATAHSHAEEGEGPKVVFGVFREDCFERFQKADFSDTSCFGFTISKLLGFAIIAGSAIVKFPQILKIHNSGSVKGLSAASLYTETINYVNTSAYSMHLGLAFSVYGETLIILVQNAIIIMMIWNLDKAIGAVEKLLFTLFIGAYSFVLFQDQVLTEEYWAMIVSSSIGLNILSRVPQIWSNISNKSTGALAFATCLLFFLGSAARAATVMAESDDFMYRAQFLIAAGLNTILVLQFFIYDDDAKKVQADGETKKSK